MTTRILRRVALLSVATAAACGGDDTSTPAPVQDVPVTGTVVQGYVVRVNPTFLVAAPADGPQGSAPQPKSLVRVTDKDGVLLGMAVTGKDGFFQVQAPADTGGLVTVAAQNDLETTGEPAVSLSVTAAPGVTTTVSAKYAITRDAAAAAALGVAEKEALVAGVLDPLPAGVNVTSSSGDAKLTLDRPTWLFVADPTPTLLHGHRLQFITVAADTGAVSVTEAGSYPLVNDVPMWSGLEGFYDVPLDLKPGATLRPRPELVRSSPPLAGPVPDEFVTNTATPAAPVAGGPDVWAIVVNGDTDRAIVNGRDSFAAFLRAQGVPAAQVTVLPTSPTLPFTSTPNPFSSLPLKDQEAELKTAIRRVAQEVATARQAGRKPTLIYYHASHGYGGAVQLAGKTFSLGKSFLAPFFQGGAYGLLDVPACRVRLLVEACESGGVVTKVGDALAEIQGEKPDVVVYTATDSAIGAGINQVFGVGLSARWTNLVVSEARVEDNDLVNIATPIAGQLVPRQVFQELRNTPNPALSPYELQNPQAMAFTGTRDCAVPSAVPPPPPFEEIPASKRSAFVFVNETKDEASVVISSDTHPINDGAPIQVGPAGSGRDRFQIEVDGAVRGLQLREFSPPQGRVPDVGGRFDIPMGMRQSFTWRQVRDGRTLVIARESLAQ